MVGSLVDFSMFWLFVVMSKYYIFLLLAVWSRGVAEKNPGPQGRYRNNRRQRWRWMWKCLSILCWNPRATARMNAFSKRLFPLLNALLFLLGIPIRTTMDNSTTVQYAGLIHQLTAKARSTVRDIDPQVKKNIKNYRYILIFEGSIGCICCFLSKNNVCQNFESIIHPV